jgi:hypothetical protein
LLNLSGNPEQSPWRLQVDREHVFEVLLAHIANSAPTMSFVVCWIEMSVGARVKSLVDVIEHIRQRDRSQRGARVSAPCA